jgi:serine/threonine protein kinase
MLGEEDSDHLLVHLQDCESCQQSLETIDGGGGEDTFIRELRGATGGSGNDSILSEPEFRSATAKALAALAKMDEFAADISLPYTIGEYEIVESIGRGGMGRVFLGRHTKLGRKVAVKVLAQHRRWDQRMHDRFETEMRAIGGLNHPNIVVAHDARDVDGVAVLVTEYVEGLDGSDLLKRKGRLSIPNACRIAAELCKALDYIAEKKLIHRDVKPSNVMIDDSGNVKLLDLGLARIQTVDGETEFTATGQAMGTADYVAPEQINDARNVDARADLYGLGCTLYKLLAGRAPFAGDEYATTYAKMNAHVSQSPQRLSQFREEVPRELESLVHRMLEKKPADRPESAKEAQTILRKFATGSELGALIKEARTLPRSKQHFDKSNKGSVETKAMPQTLISFCNRIPWWATLASLLAAFGAGMLMQIAVTVEKQDGSKADVVIPDGSTAIVDAEGNITIKLASGGEGAIASNNVEYENKAEKDGPFSDVELAGAPLKVIFQGVPIDESATAAKPGDQMDIVTHAQMVRGRFVPQLLIAQADLASMRQEKSEFGIYTTTSVADFILDKKSRGRVKDAWDRNLFARAVLHDENNILKSDRYHLQGVWSGRLPNDVAFAIAFVNNRVVFFYPNGNGLAAKFEVESTGKPGKARLLRVIGSKGNTSLSDEWDGSEFWFEESNQLSPDTLFIACSSVRGVITRMTRVKNARNNAELAATLFLKNLKNEPVRISLNVQNPFDAEKIELKDIEYDKTPLVTNHEFVAVEVVSDPRGVDALNVTLNEFAGDKMRLFTSQNVGSKLVVVMDGNVVCAPRINSEIGSNLMLEGDFTKEQLLEISRDSIPMSRIDRQNASEQNLRDLGTGLFNYESRYQKFPASRHKAKSWKHPFSWRVAILPYIDEEKLYSQFRFDEPWDSDHNLKVAKAMPEVFRLPGDAPDSYHTHYLAVSNRRTIIAIDKPVGFGQITDGTSSTVMLIQAEKKAVWTQPDDFEITDDSIDELVTQTDPLFTLLMGDGSVHTIRRDKLTAGELKSALLRDDGNYFDYEKLLGSENLFLDSSSTFIDLEFPKLSEDEVDKMRVQEGLPIDVPTEFRNVAPSLDKIDVPLKDQRR